MSTSNYNNDSGSDDNNDQAKQDQHKPKSNQINFRLFDGKGLPELPQTQKWFTGCYSVVEKHKNGTRNLSMKNEGGKK